MENKTPCREWFCYTRMHTLLLIHGIFKEAVVDVKHSKFTLVQFFKVRLNKDFKIVQTRKKLNFLQGAKVILS